MCACVTKSRPFRNSCSLDHDFPLFCKVPRSGGGAAHTPYINQYAHKPLRLTQRLERRVKPARGRTTPPPITDHKVEKTRRPDRPPTHLRYTNKRNSQFIHATSTGTCSHNTLVRSHKTTSLRHFCGWPIGRPTARARPPPVAGSNSGGDLRHCEPCLLTLPRVPSRQPVAC